MPPPVRYSRPPLPPPLTKALERETTRKPRSSSDDSLAEAKSDGPPPPASIVLDRSFVAGVEHFRASWEALDVCASFR